MSTPTRPQRPIGLLAALVAFVPLSIDTYLPSLPDITRELQAEPAQVQLTIGVFLAGLCSAILFYGPLSDRYGRRPWLIVSLVIYILASIGCVLAQNIEQLICLRFAQAVGGAGALVLARTVVRDLYPLTDAARVLSLMHVIAMLATLIAPVLGTYLAMLYGWRSIFMALVLLACACLAVTWRHLPESLPATARSQAVGVAFGHYLKVLSDPLAMLYILCMGLSVGGMFSFITASPFVFIEHFGMTPRAFSWLFGVNIAGIIIAALLNARFVRRFGPSGMLGVGSLMAALAGVLLIVSGVSEWTQPASIIAGVMLYMAVNGLIGANCMACLMSRFSRNAGAAVGLAIALQYACGALFSWLVSHSSDGTPVAMCLTMGFCGVAGLASYLAVRKLSRSRVVIDPTAPQTGN